MVSTNQVLNNLLHALLGCLHTFLGSFEGDLFALRTRAREAHHHATILVSQVPEDLPTTSHKVAMVLGVNDHRVLNDIVLSEISKYF